MRESKNPIAQDRIRFISINSTTEEIEGRGFCNLSDGGGNTPNQP